MTLNLILLTVNLKLLVPFIVKNLSRNMHTFKKFDTFKKFLTT